MKWDERYAQKEFAYGTKANDYLKLRLGGLKPGKILFPADGEGRNSVYAAELGWEVTAFDQSVNGKKKAIHLADSKGVSIDYLVGDLSDMTFSAEQFDAIVFVYAHFNSLIKSSYHQKLATFLKIGGHIIFEAFSKNHINYNTKNPAVGGPKDIETLFSVDEIRSDFRNFDILELEEKEIELNEGLYHIGMGSVIRFSGIKKSS
jgi:SAM-dependent methyltransferase